MSLEIAGPEPKFQPGQAVRVDDRTSLGHCRAPMFVRGKTGTVTLIQGAYRDPERLAYHQPGLPPQVVYKVRFNQTDLWADYTGNPKDQLELDVFENWLQPAGS